MTFFSLPTRQDKVSDRLASRTNGNGLLPARLLKAARLMPRSEARLFNAIWNDREWRDFTVSARHMYAFLLTQDNLAHCGLIPLTESRWARKAGVSIDSVREDLSTLSSARYVVIDRGTDELLVRSLARRDRVLLQPKLWMAFATSARQVESVLLRSVLLAELARCRSEGLVNASLIGSLDGLIESLSRTLDSQVASLNDSQDGTERESQAGSVPLIVLGEGARNGSNQRGPVPLEAPRPRGAGPAQRVTTPPATAAVTKGEGDSPGSGNPPRASVDALVSEIRSLRPDWSTRSIRRTLAAEDVAERPWHLVQHAFPTVAKDPESKSPGRLAHDGPWWHRKGPAAAPAPRPPWCGECDEATRLTFDDNPHRCPTCHPLAEASP